MNSPQGPEVNSTTASSAVQRAALFGGLASLTTVFMGIVRAKVVAHVLGPEGLGTAASITQITSLLFVPLTLITGPALVSALARARGPAGQPYHDSAATLVLGLGGGLVLASVATSAVVFHNQGPMLVGLTALAAVAVLGEHLLKIPSAGLLARGDVRRYAIVTTGTTPIAVLVATCGTLIAGLEGQFISMAVMPWFLMLGFGWVWRAGLPDIRLSPRPLLDRDFVRQAAAVGTATLVTGMASQLALSAIRSSLWQQGGAEANGQFQAAWAVGATYLGIVLQGLGTGIFPRYAAASREALPAEVDAAAKFVFDAAPPLILIAIAVRGPVIHLLYSAEFDVAGQMVGYQMAGDLAKALSHVYGGVLLYRGEVRAFILTEVVGAALLGLVAAILIPSQGPMGAAYGYVIAYAIYLVLVVVVVARTCGVPIRPRLLLAALGFTGAAVAAVVGCTLWPWMRWPLLFLGTVWGSQSSLARLVWAPIARRLYLLVGRT